MGQKQLGSKAVMVEAEEEEVGCPGDLEGEGKEEVKTVGKEHLPRTKGYDGCFLVWLCSYLPGTMWVNTGGGGASYTWGFGTCCCPEDINKEENDRNGFCQLFSKCHPSSQSCCCFLSLWNLLIYSTNIC